MARGPRGLATGDRAGRRGAGSGSTYEFPARESGAAGGCGVLRPCGQWRVAPARGPPSARDFERAQRLLAAARYPEARTALLDLEVEGLQRGTPARRFAPGGVRVPPPALPGRTRSAAPRTWTKPRPSSPKWLFYYASVQRGLKNTSTSPACMRALEQRFPESRWPSPPLDALATYYVVEDQDERAIRTSYRELLAPLTPPAATATALPGKPDGGTYSSRSVRRPPPGFFDRAGRDFPPIGLPPERIFYWSARRARDAMGDRTTFARAPATSPSPTTAVVLRATR